jgi:protein-tyrosine phosphatase
VQGVRPLLEGTFNSRDVGGRRAAGGVVRRHLLIRSDAPVELGAGGQAVVRKLGVRSAIDLREPIERQLDPVDVDGLPLDVRHAPILDDDFDLEAHRSMGLSELYVYLLEHRAQQLVAAIRLLSRPDALPAVVFCSAGKDRTGLVIALVLDALGVAEDEIVEDYNLTERAGVDFRAAIEARAVAAGLTEQELAVKLGAPPAVMRDALSWVRGTYGSVPRYLLASGLTEPELDRLRQALVNPDGAPDQ